MMPPGNPSPALHQVILAFDFGLKRIGLAAGDTVSSSARPLKMLPMTHAGPDWPAIEREIRTHGPQLLLVGAPYNEDGSSSGMTQAAAQFAAQLAARSALPVEQVDERYSSIEAAGQLKARRASGAHPRRLQRGELDSAAAAVILESWLQRRQQSTDQSTDK